MESKRGPTGSRKNVHWNDGFQIFPATNNSIWSRVIPMSRGRYGSPRVHAELAAEGVPVGRHKVARLMRLERLRGRPKWRFRVTTQHDPAHPVAKNLLKQGFKTKAPNRRWAGDITYIPTGQGRLYLAVVMDLYSRRIVGWSMSHWMGRHLVVDALRMAIDARRPDGPLIHHSDRGGQYTSDDFRNELAKHGIECSMSGSANCYERALQSSRRLEREAGRNVEVMWLTRRLAPDHKTIADFRKDNGAAKRTRA